MTIKETVTKIKNNLQKLNDMNKNVVFSLVEDKDGIGFDCHSAVSDGSYGAYHHKSFFDDFKRKADAYENAYMASSLLISGVKFLDAKAYHNFVANN